MDIKALIEELNQTDEHHSIEAKTGSEPGKSLMETVSAFANEPGLNGGHILLGVKRDEATLFPSYSVVGVENPDQVSADISTKCASMFNRPVRPRVETELVNEKPVIGVYVPESEKGDKPIYIKSRGLPDGAFRRIGSTDQSCTEDDLLVLLEGRRSEAFDRSLIHEATLDDIDADAIENYRRARGNVNPEAAELEWSDEDLLYAINAVRKKRGGLKPTVAGILLFGTKISLRRLFPAVRVDYVRVDGREWIGNADERYVSTVEMRGPIMQVIRKAQAAVMDDLPKGFALQEGDLHRGEPSALPRRALREAIVNALMHRDYRTHQPTQIIRYSNRVEIVNAGYSLKAEEKLGEVGSQQRNPTIAAALHETGVAETKGSGIRVMRRLMEAAGLAPPTFESDRDSNQFTARLLMHHFLSAEDLEWLDRFDELSPDQMKALIFVREVGAIDNATFRQLNGVGVLEASTALRKLRKGDLLKKQGSGKATYYVPGKAFLEPTDKGAREADRKGSEQVLSGEHGPLSEDPTSLSEEVTSVDKDLPEKLRERVASVGKRTSPEVLREVIIDLCNWRALQADQIAQLTSRNVNYLVSNYLTPMVDEGKLEHTIPEMRNHPDQAYQTPTDT